MSATIVETLDVDALPGGQKTNLLLNLIHDGMGRPLQLPIMVARGGKPGPVFGITAALHGNELNGIPVIHRLFDRLDVRGLRGTIVAVIVVNVQAYLRHQRRFVNEVDLNHIMPGVENGNVSSVYAFRLIDRVVKSFDYLVDLHTASFGRVNSLYIRADMSEPRAARMAHLLRPQIIVHNPPSDGTLRGAAMGMGIPSITLEIGDPQRFQPGYIRSSLVGIRSILADLKMIPKRKLKPRDAPVICSSSGWMYTDWGGLLEVFPSVTDRVEEGEVVARLTDVFGDVTREYCAPSRGIVIGKSVNPVGQTGARILHLGDIAPDASVFLEDSALEEEEE